jgi:hypothetical protein
MIIALAYLNTYLDNLSIIFQILIVIFNLIVFLVSKREVDRELVNSHNNLGEVKIITN